MWGLIPLALRLLHLAPIAALVFTALGTVQHSASSAQLEASTVAWLLLLVSTVLLAHTSQVLEEQACVTLLQRK